METFPEQGQRGRRKMLLWFRTTERFWDSYGFFSESRAQLDCAPGYQRKLIVEGACFNLLRSETVIAGKSEELHSAAAVSGDNVCETDITPFEVLRLSNFCL